jgi:excisionase family DNA binding protein
MNAVISGLTTSEAARRLGLSAVRVRQLLAAGELLHPDWTGPAD